jgi:hypothetical protein
MKKEKTPLRLRRHVENHMSIHTTDFYETKLLQPKQHLMIAIYLETLVTNPLLAVSEVGIEALFSRWYPMQPTSQAAFFLLYTPILFFFDHFLFTKFQVYSLRIAMVIAAFGLVEQQVVAWIAFHYGFVGPPIFWVLFSFLSCQILHWCP